MRYECPLSTRVTARPIEGRGNILLNRFDSQLLGKQLPQVEAFLGGIMLRHEEAQTRARPQGPHAEGSGHAAVDSTGKPQDHALAA